MADRTFIVNVAECLQGTQLLTTLSLTKRKFQKISNFCTKKPLYTRYCAVKRYAEVVCLKQWWIVCVGFQGEEKGVPEDFHLLRRRVRVELGDRKRTF